MKPFSKKLTTALSVLALMGLNACDTSTPASQPEEGQPAESTEQSFLDIKAPKDFAFSVYNEKGLTIKLSIQTDKGLVAYPGARINIIEGGTNKKLYNPLTNENGEVSYDGSNLSASAEKVGISIYAAGIPEDTLWYSKAQLEALDRILIVNPSSYATAVAKKSAIAAKAGAEVSAVFTNPSQYTEYKNHTVIDYMYADVLFEERDPLSINPSWLGTKEFTITALTDPSVKDSLWAHFMHTGAGYQNAFGYYWYKKSANPTGALAGINKVTLFDLVDGFYGIQNGAPRVLVGTVTDFQAQLANTSDEIVIGYWLQADYEQGANPSAPIWYTNVDYNVAVHGIAEKEHYVGFTAPSDPGKMILGNEDMRTPGSDRDYNDLILIVDRVTPSQNSCETNPSLCIPTCQTTTLPKESRFGFEDKYPEYGDFDFNDVVVDVDFSVISKQCNIQGVPITDASKGIEFAPQLVSASATVELVANGAEHPLGFGISLGSNLPGTVTLSNAASAVVLANVAPGIDETIIEFFDFARGEFLPSPSSIFVNTDPATGNYTAPAYATAGTYTASVAFNVGTPIAPVTVNPFIYWTHDVSREIHMKGYPLTARGVAQVPGDYANPATLDPSVSYSDNSGLPWAIEIQQSTRYPKEFQDITGAYPLFVSWASGSPLNWEATPVSGLVY